MNRMIKRKDKIMVVVIILTLIALFVVGNALSRHVARRSQEIRGCQDRCIETWSGDGPATGLADCLVECSPGLPVEME